MYNRRSTRLKEYDYSLPGYYFITICTQDNDKLFGKIIDGKMILNDAGKICKQCWDGIINHYPNAILDECIIMPDHVHGIIQTVGVQHLEPQKRYVSGKKHHPQNKYQKIIPGSIGVIIRGFKIGVTKWFKNNTDIPKIWQRNFYERVIRNDIELENVREYIRNNPLNWEIKKRGSSC
ncbi:MAG: hypothetical protein KAS62_11825 [Candidatus Delongbacteria bacterium]|nr:hypothetical protein [Candidatus Delongbacteria bacterium]